MRVRMEIVLGCKRQWRRTQFALLCCLFLKLLYWFARSYQTKRKTFASCHAAKKNEKLFSKLCVHPVSKWVKQFTLYYYCYYYEKFFLGFRIVEVFHRLFSWFLRLNFGVIDCDLKLSARNKQKQTRCKMSNMHNICTECVTLKNGQKRKQFLMKYWRQANEKRENSRTFSQNAYLCSVRYLLLTSGTMCGQVKLLSLHWMVAFLRSLLR